MGFWSGYRRHVRHGGQCSSMWVPRVRCRACKSTHALLPAFVLTNRLDVAETIGAVIDTVARGISGVRPAAASVDVPHTTARGWMRRFTGRARALGVAFAALAAELGGEVADPLVDALRDAHRALGAAFRAATSLPGWLGCGRWRFASATTGGSLVATNTNSPYLVVGRRRFMPPVP